MISCDKKIITKPIIALTIVPVPFLILSASPLAVIYVTPPQTIKAKATTEEITTAVDKNDATLANITLPSPVSPTRGDTTGLSTPNQPIEDIEKILEIIIFITIVN